MSLNIILFESKENRTNLLPLCFTKPSGELRMGIFTFKERLEQIFNSNISYKTEPYLNIKFPERSENYNHYINPCFFPNEEIINQIHNLKLGDAIFYKEELIVFYGAEEDFSNQKFKEKKEITKLIKIAHTWDLFKYNEHAIEFDFNLITKNKQSLPIPDDVKTKGNKIFIEEGAKVSHAILNSEFGAIYVGKDSEIMEGAMVRGGLALCQGAKLNMGAKIYGATTIGPFSKVGGEVNNSVITAYSNKGHDGFLGNSVIGEWCNLGADTNNSNLKNNYKKVKMWNYESESFLNTEMQFCGLIMGDHSKSAINTQFNTGTTVGVGASLFHTGFLPQHIKSFTWGGKRDSEVHLLEHCCETAATVMQRRNVNFTNLDKDILEYIYNLEKN